MKYELIPIEGNAKLARIRALRNVPTHNVHVGELGGIVEHIDNLAQEGDAWVTYDACVLKEARVEGNAFITDRARVTDEALVSGNAYIGDTARIGGSVFIADDVRITGTVQLVGEMSIVGQSRIGGQDSIDIPLPKPNVILTTDG